MDSRISFVESARATRSITSSAVMNTLSKPKPRRVSGWLFIALACLTAWVLSTAIALRDPLKLMLEWELLAVFVRPETHGWYRAVIAMVACDAITGSFMMAGAGWLALLAWRKSARFPVQVQAWLLIIVVMRTLAYLLGEHMTRTIGIHITIPFDGFIQAVAAASLGIPYFRLSRRVRQTFVAA
jgi:Protein of unknown function (DUF2569)